MKRHTVVEDVCGRAEETVPQSQSGTETPVHNAHNNSCWMWTMFVANGYGNVTWSQAPGGIRTYLKWPTLNSDIYLRWFVAPIQTQFLGTLSCLCSVTFSSREVRVVRRQRHTKLHWKIRKLNVFSQMGKHAFVI